MQTQLTAEQRAFTVERMDAERLAFFNACTAQEQLGIALLWNLHSVTQSVSDAAEKQLVQLGFWVAGAKGGIKEGTKVAEYYYAYYA